MESIDAHLAQDRVDLQRAREQGDQAKVGHLEVEIRDLETYKSRHPDEQQDPSPLEVYCDLNPAASECRVYDD